MSACSEAMLTIAPFFRRLHRRQNGAGREPGRFEIDGEHVLPFLLGHRHRIGVDVASGVVDETVDRPEHFGGRLERPGDVGRAPTSPAANEARFPASATEEVAPRGFVEIDDRDERAFGERLGGDRGADAARAPGHQDMPPLDPSGHRRLSPIGDRAVVMAPLDRRRLLKRMLLGRLEIDLDADAGGRSARHSRPGSASRRRRSSHATARQRASLPE